MKEEKLKKLVDVKKKLIPKLKKKAFEKDITVKKYLELIIENDLNT